MTDMRTPTLPRQSPGGLFRVSAKQRYLNNTHSGYRVSSYQQHAMVADRLIADVSFLSTEAPNTTGHPNGVLFDSYSTSSLAR
jgi:hypothetical protein